MGTMMAWMMGLGLLGWVLLVALVVTVLVALAGFVGRSGSAPRPSGDGASRPGAGRASGRLD